MPVCVSIIACINLPFDADDLDVSAMLVEGRIDCVIAA